MDEQEIKERRYEISKLRRKLIKVANPIYDIETRELVGWGDEADLDKLDGLLAKIRELEKGLPMTEAEEKVFEEIKRKKLPFFYDSGCSGPIDPTGVRRPHHY